MDSSPFSYIFFRFAVFLLVKWQRFGSRIFVDLDSMSIVYFDLLGKCPM